MKDKILKHLLESLKFLVFFAGFIIILILQVKLGMHFIGK